MSIITQTREIDGMVFTVTQLPGFKGLRMFARLGRLFGPGLSRGLAGVGKVNMSSMKNLKNVEIDMQAIGEAIGVLFERVSEQELEALTRDLLETATVNNKPLIAGFDLLMQGKTLTILKLLKFAFEVNYGSFLPGLRALAAMQAADKV